MLSLNLRQIKILDHLLRHEVSQIDDLLAYAKISSRTLQSDIISINSELQRQGYDFSINSNHNRGYASEPNDTNRDAFELVKAQCISYLDNEIIYNYGDNTRVSYLIRCFLTSDDYIKSEDLVDDLNISLATLTNDMRTVRALLEQYHILLQSTPYYGMKVVGNPYSIRSCLLDFCDIYDIYADNYVFVQEAIEQYHIDITSMHSIRTSLYTILHKHGVHVSERGFTRLLFYILIKQGGYDFFPLEEVYIPDDPFAQQRCSEELVACFQLKDPFETQFLRILLMANQDYLSIEELSNSPYEEEIQGLLVKIVTALKTEIHLDLGKQPCVLDVLHSFLFNFWIRQNYLMHEFNSSMKMRSIVRDLPASCSLSNMILELLRFFTQESYDSYHIATLTLKLFNIIFTVPNEYNPVRIAFVGTISTDVYDSVFYRLDTTERYNITKDHFSFYEVDRIDYALYDCVFVIAAERLKLKDCPLPVFNFDYFLDFKQRSDFYERMLAKHRVENFLLYKTDNMVHIMIENTHHNYIDEIVAALNGYGHTSIFNQKVIENMIHENISYYQFDPFILCLMWKEELAHTLFVFDLQTPEVLDEMSVHTIQIVIMDPNDNVQAVKQADSYVRRMQRRAIL